ncbi:hypothetical protein [Streptomyces sp. NPDC048644]|uniref:hypothetical protein n=1 Tax=Streptomyces sp. NPDC048644 TaxID=3365582 RepID=UPI00371A5496
MADHEIDDGVLVNAALGLGVTSEDVEDLAAVVVPRGYLGVGVVVSLSAGELQTLDLVALRVVDEPEVRIRVPARFVVGEAARLDALPNPVLEVVFLVARRHSLDQVAVRPSAFTFQKYLLDRAHLLPSVCSVRPTAPPGVGRVSFGGRHRIGKR